MKRASRVLDRACTYRRAIKLQARLLSRHLQEVMRDIAIFNICRSGE
jgi:hypothetical protein